MSSGAARYVVTEQLASGELPSEGEHLGLAQVLEHVAEHQDDDLV